MTKNQKPVIDVEQVLEAWRINNRVNLFLVKNISNEGLHCTLSKRGGRNVVRQLAHLHNNRVWHLQRRAKKLAEGATLFETHDEPSRRVLSTALKDSGQRIEKLIQLVSEGAPGVRAFKRGLVPYVAYFVAHESHHRGNILLTLKQTGHRLDSPKSYAIWDWDRI
jgi:uncharacterized damage-inducible protein DinB